MHALAPSIVSLVLAMLLSACGSTTTAGDVSANDVVIRPDVAQDHGTTEDPGTATDVDAPGHPHPYWPDVTWDGIWPETDMGTATYRITFVRDGMVKDLTAAFRDGMVKQDWGSSAPWTRLAFGTLSAGEYAMALYFDQETPWTVKVLGAEWYFLNDAEPTAQWFDPPILIPLDLKAMATPQHIVTDVSILAPGSAVKTINMVLDVQAISYASQCPAPLEPTNECAEYRVAISGEFAGGGGPLVSQVILHPLQRILSWSNAPGFSQADLIVPWQ